MQTISILGAGWLGLPLGKKLAAEGHTVKGSTTSEEKKTRLESQGLIPYVFSLGPHEIQGDFRDFFQADLLLLNIPPGRRDPHVRTHFPQKIQVLLGNLSKKASLKCIFISSTSVYGNQEGIISESNPVSPTTNSGAALVEAEELIKNHIPQTSILRMGGLVGNERHPGRFLAGRTGISGGNDPVNLIHLEDCIGIIKALIQQDLWGETFNCVADKHPSKASYYIQAAKALNLEPPQFLSDAEKGGKCVSNQKVKEVLSYSFKYADPMDMLANKNS